MLHALVFNNAELAFYFHINKQSALNLNKSMWLLKDKSTQVNIQSETVSPLSPKQLKELMQLIWLNQI